MEIYCFGKLFVGPLACYEILNCLNVCQWQAVSIIPFIVHHFIFLCDENESFDSVAEALFDASYIRMDANEKLFIFFYFSNQLYAEQNKFNQRGFPASNSSPLANIFLFYFSFLCYKSFFVNWMFCWFPIESNERSILHSTLITIDISSCAWSLTKHIVVVSMLCQDGAYP